MSNILHFTELFTDAYWTANNGLIVTPSSAPPPSFAGSLAGRAMNISDPGASLSYIIGTFETIPNDSSDWLASWFVKKDAIASRFPTFAINLFGGTAINALISLNTSTGAVADQADGTACDAKGTIDYGDYWRVWYRKANNSTGNVNARVFTYPSYTNALGDFNDAAVTGNIDIWGVNLTNSSAVLTYEPDPFYAFINPTPCFATIDSKRVM